jgi:hypothetical protein
MFVARWQIDARFRHKRAVIDLMHYWLKGRYRQDGWGAKLIGFAMCVMS